MKSFDANPQFKMIYDSAFDPFSQSGCAGDSRPNQSWRQPKKNKQQIHFIEHFYLLSIKFFFITVSLILTKLTKKYEQKNYNLLI
jgi:hypothetical protein